MRSETERLIVRTAEAGDDGPFLKYLQDNRSFLEEWEPRREAEYFTAEHCRQMLENQLAAMKAGTAYHFVIEKRGEPGIIGSIGISNIVYSVFQSCFLGYKLSSREINKGYMTEALAEVIRFIFGEVGLHRIEANIMPRNLPSMKVLRKLGFEFEGRSRNYLRINGVWEDHDHYVLLNQKSEQVSSGQADS